MYDMDEHIEYPDVPDPFREVQQTLDAFVAINYETARSANIGINPASQDMLVYYQGRIIDIIRNNPPLESVPKYFRDGRQDYLWYSDFYDDITKDVYHKYRIFAKPVNEITTANYAEELAKIDLPYFTELVNLISLERLLPDYQSIEYDLKDINTPPESTEATLQESISEPKQRLPAKRSYEPKLTDKQYRKIAECIESIELFRNKIKVSQFKQLFTGKLSDPLQVANQKSLVYLLDQLSENKYIKKAWISVADKNRDFISFRTDGNKRRYGAEPHFINMQQFLNNRNRNKREYIEGLIEIDELIEEL